MEFKQLARFESFNPFRSPAWRWERVKRLAERWPAPGRASPRDDAWIRQAREFYIRWPRASESEREDMLWDNEGLAYAYLMYEKRVADPNPALFCEGRLLANQSIETIAHELSTRPETISWYEALFFDVRGHLSQRDWITSRVLLPPIMHHLTGAPQEQPQEPDEGPTPQRRPFMAPIVEYASPFADCMLRYFCYFGGPVVADLLIYGIQTGKMIGSPEEVTTWLDGTLLGSVKRRALLTAQQMTVNKFNAVELLNVAVNIINIERAARQAAGKESTLEKHIKTLLDDIPWVVGNTPGVDEQHLVPHRHAPGDFRDDELLTGNLPVEEVMRALPPPRPQHERRTIGDPKADFVQGN